MTFPEKPTTKNLSDTPEVAAFPSYFSSMAGGNMMSEKNPHFAGQGTDSEAAHDVVSSSMTDFGNVQKTPVLTDDAPTPESHLSTDADDGGYAPGSTAWKEI